jgi:flavodoxin
MSMNTLVLYESQFGNTKHIAELIGKELEDYGQVRVTPIAEYQPALLAGVDLVLVGAPTQAHGMTDGMRRFVDNFEARPKGLSAAAFDTRVKGPQFLWGSAAREIAVRLARNGFRVPLEPESFLVTLSKQPELHEGEDRHAKSWARHVGASISDGIPAAV